MKTCRCQRSGPCCSGLLQLSEVVGFLRFVDSSGMFVVVSLFFSLFVGSVMSLCTAKALYSNFLARIVVFLTHSRTSMARISLKP